MNHLEQPSAVALGYFDGVHRGHRRVLSLAAKQAEQGLLPVCLTFSESPRAVLTGQPVPSLMTREDKVRALHEIGIRRTLFADFRELKSLSARAFFSEILVRALHAQTLFCGFNYRFGKNAEGDAKLLKALCADYGITLCVVPPETMDGEIVSSTKIRTLIADGEIRRANRMLGANFGFASVITHGQRLGRELGTPTLNQPLAKGLVVPRFGVYASAVTLPGGERFCGVTNVGVKPTVGSDAPLWETWMPDYHGGEIYGQTADVRLLQFLRPERKFNTLTDLRNAIVKNGEQARAVYESYR